MSFCRAAVVVAMCLVFAAPASAGTYDVALCRASTGAPIGSDGWARFDQGAWGTSSDQCAVAMPRLLSAFPPNTAVAKTKHMATTTAARQKLIPRLLGRAPGNLAPLSPRGW